MTCAGVSRVGARVLRGRWSGTRSAGEARAFLMARGYDVGRIRSWARWLLSAAGEPPLTPTSVSLFPPTSTTSRVAPRASSFLVPRRTRCTVWGALDGTRGEGRGQGRRNVVWSQCSRGRIETARCTKGGVRGFTLARRPRRCAIALASVFGAQLVARTREAGDESVGDRPVLLLPGIQLGLDGVNTVYHVTIKVYAVTFPLSVGIAGGRPSSSYYFVGVQRNGHFYLDPHHSRPAVPLRPFMDKPAPPPAHGRHAHDDRRSLRSEANTRSGSLSPDLARGGSLSPDFARAGSMSPEYGWGRGRGRGIHP
ncbi:hypothetical protein DFH09DRAFT_1095095 [Mycena vulgaris]|nr:hypothetical protein DFH09DRAFT_1095095 [Mycena vulgaris]